MEGELGDPGPKNVKYKSKIKKALNTSLMLPDLQQTGESVARQNDYEMPSLQQNESLLEMQEMFNDNQKPSPAPMKFARMNSNNIPALKKSASR